MDPSTGSRSAAEIGSKLVDDFTCLQMLSQTSEILVLTLPSSRLPLFRLSLFRLASDGPMGWAGCAGFLFLCLFSLLLSPFSLLFYIFLSIFRTRGAHCSLTSQGVHLGSPSLTLTSSLPSLPRGRRHLGVAAVEAAEELLDLLLNVIVSHGFIVLIHKRERQESEQFEKPLTAITKSRWH